MDFLLWVQPRRGAAAPCGHLSSYFQPPETLSQKSTPHALSHPRHHVVCIYLSIYLFHQSSWEPASCFFFFFSLPPALPPMSSCCTLSLATCPPSAANITDDAIPKSFFSPLYIVSSEGRVATWDVVGVLVCGLAMKLSMGAPIECRLHIHFFIVFQGFVHPRPLSPHYLCILLTTAASAIKKIWGSYSGSRCTWRSWGFQKRTPSGALMLYLYTCQFRVRCSTLLGHFQYSHDHSCSKYQQHFLSLAKRTSWLAS